MRTMPAMPPVTGAHHTTTFTHSSPTRIADSPPQSVTIRSIQTSTEPAPNVAYSAQNATTPAFNAAYGNDHSAGQQEPAVRDCQRASQHKKRPCAACSISCRVFTSPQAMCCSRHPGLKKLPALIRKLGRAILRGSGCFSPGGPKRTDPCNSTRVNTAPAHTLPQHLVWTQPPAPLACKSAMNSEDAGCSSSLQNLQPHALLGTSSGGSIRSIVEDLSVPKQPVEELECGMSCASEDFLDARSCTSGCTAGLQIKDLGKVSRGTSHESYQSVVSTIAADLTDFVLRKGTPVGLAQDLLLVPSAAAATVPRKNSLLRWCSGKSSAPQHQPDKTKKLGTLASTVPPPSSPGKTVGPVPGLDPQVVQDSAGSREMGSMQRGLPNHTMYRQLQPSFPSWMPEVPLRSVDASTCYIPVPECVGLGGYWAKIPERSTPQPLPIDNLIKAHWLARRAHHSIAGVKVVETANRLSVTAQATLYGMSTIYKESYLKDGSSSTLRLRRDIRPGNSLLRMYCTAANDVILVSDVVNMMGTVEFRYEELVRVAPDGETILFSMHCHSFLTGKSATQFFTGRKAIMPVSK